MAEEHTESKADGTDGLAVTNVLVTVIRGTTTVHLPAPS
jgi:hypothetical protein